MDFMIVNQSIDADQKSQKQHMGLTVTNKQKRDTFISKRETGKYLYEFIVS